METILKYQNVMYTEVKTSYYLLIAYPWLLKKIPIFKGT